MKRNVSLPLQLLITLITVIIFGKLLPLHIADFFYSISLLLKEFLSFMLPFMVFSFISVGLLSFKKNTPLIIAILLISVFISNVLTPLISYLSCNIFLYNITNKVVIEHIAINKLITPLFTVKLPHIISPEWAIFLAIFTGTLLSLFKLPQAEQAIVCLKQNIEWIINNLFIPLLPLYIFGFLLDIHYKEVFLQLFQTYGKTYAFIISLQILLLFLMYLFASSFNLKKTFKYIKRAIPSYITAFGTMSSAAAIPVTIKCAEKNTNNKALSEVATPILANIHMFGDAITVPVLAIVTIFLFQGIIPTVSTFFEFFIYFSLTMLAASGIPGGGMIVMIPILKSILGCTDTMISIMLTLHLLQDGFGTGANVMGDGALMIIINNILKKIDIK